MFLTVFSEARVRRATLIPRHLDERKKFCETRGGGRGDFSDFGIGRGGAQRAKDTSYLVIVPWAGGRNQSLTIIKGRGAGPT